MPLNNFGMVVPGFWRCAQPDTEAWQTLHHLVRFSLRSIHSIVYKLNTEGEYPRAKEAEEAGPEVEIEAVEVNQWKPDVATIRKLVEKIEEVRTGTHSKLAVMNVLIHCTHGRDRTGLVVGAWRLIYGGWTFERMQAERRAYGAVGLIALADKEIDEALAQIARDQAK